MANKKKVLNWWKNIHLSDETKYSIKVIFVLVLAILLIFSLFDMAGVAGKYLLEFLKALFGRSFFIWPFIFLILGILMIDSERFGVRPIHYFGGFLFILSLSGLLHLRREPIVILWNNLKQGVGGGYIGWFVSAPLFKIMGFWGALVVLIAMFLISLFLIFNTSFDSLLGKVDSFRLLKEQMSSRWYHLFHKKDYETSDNINEEKENEDLSDDEEDLSDDENQEIIEDIKEPEFSSKGLKQSSGEQQELPEIKSIRKKIKMEIPLQLLEPSRSKPNSGDIESNKAKIKKALENFGISVEMGEVATGPTFTQYTLKPEDGIKLSRITNLNNDLSYALAAHPIRIEAPIPGKSLVGIEIPNRSIATVTLREVLDSKEFKKARDGLTFAIGKDVAGKVFTANLDKMPHLLIAGSTGSGKSVCINTLIVSLLYQNNPDDLKFILVDPKRVELSFYNDLPYLLTPVITDTQKTINALKWVVAEMDERYIKLSREGFKNISSYNAANPDDKMHYIVLVIDELADLMSVAAQEVEAAIIRLAQMARAVGIHLILATQRPSVNVITGLIKANITSRIAFAVASQTDSRTILDSSGAEKLLGKGDMLFTSAQLSKPKRLQAAFLSEEEIKRVSGYIKNKADIEVDYNESITERKKGIAGASLEGGGGEEDSLYEEAKELIIKEQKASASYLQRRLRVGYARAARLLDLLEAEGIIGPADGAKPREIMITAKDYFTADSVGMEETPTADEYFEQEERE